MTDVAAAAGLPAAAGTAAPAATPASDAPLSVADAVAQIRARREPEEQQQRQAPPQGEQRPPQERSPDGRYQAAGGPAEPAAHEFSLEELLGLNEPGAEGTPEEPAALEAPSSWASADEKARWAKLDPDTQKFIADRETKAAAERARLEQPQQPQPPAGDIKPEQLQARAQQLQTNIALALAQAQKDFADIKSPADVAKLAGEDWPRYAQFNALMMQLSHEQGELQQIHQHVNNQQKTAYDTWSQAEDAKFDSQFKEFADPAKSKAARDMTNSYLVKVVGVPAEALPNLRNEPLFRDSRFQRVVYDAARYNAMREKAADKVAAARVRTPGPQTPGTAPQRQTRSEQTLTTLQKRFDEAKSPRDQIKAAAALRAAKRAGQRG